MIGPRGFSESRTNTLWSKKATSTQPDSLQKLLRCQTIRPALLKKGMISLPGRGKDLTSVRCSRRQGDGHLADPPVGNGRVACATCSRRYGRDESGSRGTTTPTRTASQFHGHGQALVLRSFRPECRTTIAPCLCPGLARRNRPPTSDNDMGESRGSRRFNYKINVAWP